MDEFGRLLCAVEFDDTSRDALEFAVRLARRLDAHVTVVHAFEIPVYPVPEDGMVELPVEVEADVETRIARRLHEFASAVPHEGVTFDLRIVEGQVDVAVCALAEQLRPALVVVGTEGRSGLAHLMLGSIAERIVRHAPIPVLTVRHQARPGGGAR